ncbi:MAG TPA: DUF6167 family protein [Nocardioides sp.]|nr:DUF6167 family protein [Nocardioides sp.]
MSRGLWFGAGVAAGVYGMVRARRVAEAFTPDGIGDRMKAATLGARLFRNEVAQGVADSETDLRRRFGLPSPEPGMPALEASPSAHSAPNDPKEIR